RGRGIACGRRSVPGGTQVAAALALSRDSFTLARGSSIFALCRASDEANHLMEELAQRFPDATLVIRVALPVTRATLELQRGEAQGAIMLLEPVRPYDLRRSQCSGPRTSEARRTCR